MGLLAKVYRNEALCSVPAALNRWCEGWGADPVEDYTITKEWAGGEDGADYYIFGIEFATSGHRFEGEVHYRDGTSTLHSWPGHDPDALSDPDATTQQVPVVVAPVPDPGDRR
ncbi:hypothetical protein GCM10023063_15290 [Arthrobacter methylotrophus]|uniref:Uncharacterized protein n=1 Tax=Arthrobacter methylotrophus TaxID=121291 RepID=A0ABV5UN56_9MICC